LGGGVYFVWAGVVRVDAEVFAGGGEIGGALRRGRGLGVLVLFGVPIAACIACITVVGLFIGISTLFLWYASLYFAQIIVGAVIGQWLMGRTSELWPLIGRMA